MFRLFLYLAIAIGAIASVPALRRRAAPPVSAVWTRISPAVRALTDPVRASVTRREESALVRQMRQVHNAGQKLPAPNQFQRWISASSSVNRDGWGNPYFLAPRADGTLWVGSSGPDGQSGTEDDILTQCTW